MDLTTYFKATLNFHFFISKTTPLDPSDRFVVYMTNGTDTAEIVNTFLAQYSWSAKQSYDIVNYLPITRDMRVYFQINDSSGTIVESLVDAFEITDTSSINVIKIPDNWATIQAFPNPFTQSITVDYTFEKTLSKQPILIVCNALGQIMEQRKLTQQSDQLYLGSEWPAGLYFVRIGQQSIRVVKQ